MKFRNIIFGLIAVGISSMTIGCSEDDIKVDPDLKELSFSLPRGEPGSLEEMIYTIYERYGTYVLYNFEEKLIRSKWTGKWGGEYVPVKPNSEKYVREVLTFLQKNIFDSYTDDFVRKSLVSHIFLVDSVKPALSASWVDMTTDEHKYIVGIVGSRLDEYTDDKWNTFRSAFLMQFVRGFYNAASVKPTQFLGSATVGLLIPELEDPEGKYENLPYSCYMIGFVKSREIVVGRPTWLSPPEEQDFADYVTFLITTPKAEMEYILTRFGRVRERALALVPYLNNILELNVVATQNKNCPNDPIPADFFEKI